MKLSLKIVAISVLFFPLIAQARIGVGVQAGKIQINEHLKPGGIYGLPVLPVVNTGDESGNYGVSIEYLEYQDEAKPPREWFTFNPSEFSLDPGKVQEVQTKLQLPVDAKPGKYFAFLEAHPIKKDDGNGQTSVNIAAASKLYFEVAPANIWEGIYYRIVSLVNQYSPWTYVGLTVVGVLIVIALFRKFFTFRISLSRRSGNNEE